MAATTRSAGAARQASAPTAGVMPCVWGGNHFWTLKGSDGLAGIPLLARLTAILRILDSLQKNDQKMIFLHYILDWIERSLSKFKDCLNGF
ncbi:hypothetical protein [Candidatus Sodalis pierantonius]|uniref:hypothetical protein n=1 Tax=Candidatus Sodalis pierantonii TaxID=1486991 RepID=UPI00138AD1FD|nr:hypothetical protein [Candidatus Sodalis pierantonius]